jgi:hypothetical protein
VSRESFEAETKPLRKPKFGDVVAWLDKEGKARVGYIDASPNAEGVGIKDKDGNVHRVPMEQLRKPKTAPRTMDN